MRITDLPSDIIIKLPIYLHSIDDLYALLRTARCFYNLYSGTKVACRPIFRPRNGKPAFAPYLQLLMTALARKLADAVMKDNREDDLRHHVHRADKEDLDEYATRMTTMTLQEAQALHRVNAEVIEPYVRIVNRDTAPAWVSRHHRAWPGSPWIPDGEPREGSLDRFWPKDPRWEPETMTCNFVIYCELFHHTIDHAYSQLPKGMKPFSKALRQQWIRFFMADSTIWRNGEPGNAHGACCGAKQKELMATPEHHVTNFEELRYSRSWQQLRFQLSQKKVPDGNLIHLWRHYYWQQDVDRKTRLAVLVMEHQGLSTLKTVLLGIAAEQHEFQEIQRKVKLLTQVKDAPHPTHEEDGEDIGWRGMMEDLRDCVNEAFP